MEHPLVRGPVAEERHGHLAAAANLGGEGCARGERDSTADDGVGADHPAGEVGDVHRAASALAEPRLAAVDLGHHRLQVAPLRDRVPVTPVGARDAVVLAEVRAHAGGDAFLADVHVHEAGDVSRLELARDALLEGADRRHRAVQREQRLAREFSRHARKGRATSCRAPRACRGSRPPGRRRRYGDRT